MGEVYRARDARLNREVALKILPPEVSGDPSRRQRFEIEARAVAALNHPNIVAVYDVGAENSVSYFVSELVDGGSLRGASFGPRKTLEIAAQIAAGLACAHEAGIAHRDLKPDNILVSRDGRAKIIDFGLAKSVRTAVSSDTLTMRTEPGVVVGTVAYMSPEQVRGAEPDHRCDIFSFGSVLYELLSGKNAFRRETSIETMMAILKEDAAPLPEGIPAAVREIVAHCLEKEPQNRFQSAKDLAFALSQAASQSGAAPAIGMSARPRRLRLALVVGAVAGVAALASYYVWHSSAPEVWEASPLGGPDVAMTPRLSPDGHTLAFLAMVNRQSEVAVMKPDVGDWSLLTHHPERGSVVSLSWAPDGNRIYYDRVLDVPQGVYSIPVLGGEEQLVLEDAMSPEALPDGSLLVARLNAAHEHQLFHYWPESGRLEPLPLQIAISLFVSQVRAFPDGREAVVIGSPTGQILQPAKDLYLLNLATGRARLVVRRNGVDVIRGQGVTRDGRNILFGGEQPNDVTAVPRMGLSQPRVLFPLTSMAWALDTAPDGTLYVDQVERDSTLLRFSLKGGPAVRLGRIPVLEGASSQFAALPDGRAVWEEQTAGRSRLAIVADGQAPVPFSGTADETTFPVAVAGPKEIAFAIGKEHRTIGIASLATRRITRRIVFDKGPIHAMFATPDGQTLYCGAGGSIWMQPVSGGAPIHVRDGAIIALDPDGKYMVVMDALEGRTRLMKVPLGGGEELEIPISGSARPYIGATGAIQNGKLLFGLQAPDSWFLDPVVIDLTSGHATRIAIDAVGDNFDLSWTPDGQILAAVSGLRSSLWKFRRRPQ